jgi:hypothetical protein
MSTRVWVLVAVIGAFGALTYCALADVGYLGIIEPHFRSWGAGQVFADLVIALTLACVWMVADARTRGVNPWPFVLLTLAAGSFGPLVYLVVRELKVSAAPVTAK